MSWTDERDAALRQGRKDGLSAAVIADQLGITRNAVLGRAFRLGLGATRAAPVCPTIRVDQDKRGRRQLAAVERANLRKTIDYIRAVLAGVRCGALSVDTSVLIAMKALADRAKKIQ